MAATSSNSVRLERVFKIKFEPSLANVIAISRPIFLLAPVIIVVLPCKRIAPLHFAYSNRLTYAATIVTFNVTILTVPRDGARIDRLAV
jgi:hypothetical protein